MNVILHDELCEKYRFLILLLSKAGTWSGNLMLKHAHRDFPSDVFLLLETVGAKLNIGMSVAYCYIEKAQVRAARLF